MKSISKDAKGFVEGVMSHLKKSGKVVRMTPRVQSLLLKMTAHARREHQARVESAVRLNPAEIQTIVRILSRIAGHEVNLTADVNPSLIGGLRVTMGDWVVDTSIRNELREMARMANAT